MQILTNIAIEFPEVDFALAMREVLLGLARAYAVGRFRRPLPPLYQTRIRYQPEPQSGSGVEEWADPWTVLSRGWGDCDDLVLYRVSELFANGETRAGVVVTWRPETGRYHVQVRRANGDVEDPSRILLQR